MMEWSAALLGVSAAVMLPVATWYAIRRDQGLQVLVALAPLLAAAREEARLQADGFARDYAIYHGAHTGRQTGIAVNPT